MCAGPIPVTNGLLLALSSVNICTVHALPTVIWTVFDLHRPRYKEAPYLYRGARGSDP